MPHRARGGVVSTRRSRSRLFCTSRAAEPEDWWHPLLLLGLADHPLFELDRGLTPEDGHEHSDEAFFREEFVDRALVALEGAFLDGDVLALLEDHLDDRLLLGLLGV